MSSPTPEQLERTVDSIEDVVSYPILTSQVDSASSTNGTGGHGGGSRGGSIGSQAERSIRDAIGWRYRKSDNKGFAAALKKAFSLKEEKGHIVSTWRPQNYTVAADLGEVTGAQASLHAQAKVIVEHAVPLLDQLKSLKADSDTEDMEAIRHVISDEVSELLGELARGGGPRVHRMDTFFDLLLGDPPVNANPEQMGGQMATLRERFGLVPGRVGTIEEERNYTNYLVFADQVFALFHMWATKRPQFASGTDQFLGLQLISLSQLLEAIAESVGELHAALDSVFMGAEERQVYDITLDDNVRITLDDLFAWVQGLATVEGPRLLSIGGKDGVVAFHHTVGRLADIVAEALVHAEAEDDPANGRPGSGSGFQTGRVRRALRELHRHLASARDKSEEVGLQEVISQTETRKRYIPSGSIYPPTVKQGVDGSLL